MAPSGNGFKVYPLPSAYSARGSWKNGSLAHSRKPFLRQARSVPRMQTFSQVPAASLLPPSLKEVKELKSQNSPFSHDPLAAVPQLGGQDGH